MTSYLYFIVSGEASFHLSLVKEDIQPQIQDLSENGHKTAEG